MCYNAIKNNEKPLNTFLILKRQQLYFRSVSIGRNLMMEKGRLFQFNVKSAIIK